MGDINGGGLDNEKPVRTVNINTFALSKYEVTFTEYDTFSRSTTRVNAKDHGWGRGRYPVTGVSWQDAKDYVRWLSEKSAHHFRLPSEAEWEYAARAGTETKYSWGNSISCSLARYGHSNGDCGDEKKAIPVGSFQANAFGLYDMHGNVWEWVEDCYHDSYINAHASGEARTTGACDHLVLRGGSWDTGSWAQRAAYRLWNPPDWRLNNIGFRVAQDIE